MNQHTQCGSGLWKALFRNQGTSLLSLCSKTLSGLQVAACEQRNKRELTAEIRRQEKYEMEPNLEKQSFQR